MRLFVLVLNILVGSSLLAQPAELWAASTSAKPHKNKHRSKTAHPAKLKSAPHPGDVWVRLRSGMQIPRPGPDDLLALLPAQPLASVGLDANNTADTDNKPIANILPNSGTTLLPAPQKIKLPAASIAPLNNYTPYGRLKLNSAIAFRIRKNIALEKPLEKQPSDAKNNTSPSVIIGQPRVHVLLEPNAKFEFNSKQHKADVQQATAVLLRHSNALKTTHRMAIASPAHLGRPEPSRVDSQQQSPYQRVNKHILWHTQHRNYLPQVAERARPYLYHIVESLSQHKLPYELALLPIVESAYQPTALSPKSAAGLWQFIPSTGQEFDLQQTDQYDGRLDITASTRAAMRYLSFLKQHFKGDWLLALAAYNCGLGTVDAAIGRNQAEGLDTDYWSLRLPEETQEYVPRFLALASIFADPTAHGLKLAPVRDEPYFVKVKIDHKHDINYLAEKNFKEIAQLADLSYEQFNRLNPGYLKPKLAVEGPFTLLLPTPNAKQLHQQLTRIAQFMNESAPLATSHLVLKRRASPAPADEQKYALSLLADSTLPKAADLIKVTDPFLSLDISTSPTTPRLANQSVSHPVNLSADAKRAKKNG